MAARSPQPMTRDEFKARTGLAEDALAGLETYARILAKWQKAINLVGEKTMADLWRRHMLDSAQLIRHLPKAGAVVLDIGSGAGFPGMVLAIGCKAAVHLVESDQRKAAFLAEVNRATGAGAAIHPARIENLSPFPVDVVTARACAPLERLLEYAAPFLGGQSVGLFLKGRNYRRELTACRKKWNINVKEIPSLSDEEGVVLKLEGIRRHERD